MTSDQVKRFRSKLQRLAEVLDRARRARERRACAALRMVFGPDFPQAE
jgi:hypothetical protein